MSGPGERAADRAYRKVRRDIVTAVIPGGQRLGENDLAERYGISRTPIREALRRLQSEGLVEVLPHRGARVVDWSEIDVAAIYDLRAMVEGYAARRAALRISEEEIDRLAGLCDRMEELTGRRSPGDPEMVDQLAELNADLHGSVATAAGEYHVSAVRNIVVVVPLVLRMIHVFNIEDLQRSNVHHRELLAALRARSPEWAESVMVSHVQAAKVRLLKARAELDLADAPAADGSDT